MNFELTAKGERAEGWGGGGVRAGLNNFVKKKKKQCACVAHVEGEEVCLSLQRPPSDSTHSQRGLILSRSLLRTLVM